MKGIKSQTQFARIWNAHLNVETGAPAEIKVGFWASEAGYDAGELPLRFNDDPYLVEVAMTKTLPKQIYDGLLDLPDFSGWESVA